MIRTIHLHGALGQTFGPEYAIDVESPAEAVRALVTMIPGLRAHMEDRFYQVFRGAEVDGRDQDPQELHIRFSESETELHIVPRVAGAKRRGLGKILLGGLLIAASFIVPGAWAIAGKAVSGIVAQVGVSMVLGGVSQLLSPQPETSKEREGPKSRLFGSAQNVTSPGVPVPVIVGECEVGSVVVSAAIHVERLAYTPKANDETGVLPDVFEGAVIAGI